MRLVLFDVDGTLILTGGAGMRAYYRAMHSVFDIKVDGEFIRPDGKTDPLIAKELLAHFNLMDRWCDSSRDALFASYLGYLEEEMCRARDDGLIRVLPGVENLLQRLSGQADLGVGLVTGNLEQGARIKLEKAGLYGYFRFGGYGSDSEDRTAITRIGIQRGIQFAAPAPVEAAFVIGDTPLDIIHGRAAGAKVIAVASARYNLDDLQSYQPDMLLSDLTLSESVIAFMRSAG
jgi:phosphoglycolate phosphatase-like HAD superfamily hydrolase